MSWEIPIVGVEQFHWVFSLNGSTYTLTLGSEKIEQSQKKISMYPSKKASFQFLFLRESLLFAVHGACGLSVLRCTFIVNNTKATILSFA